MIYMQPILFGSVFLRVSVYVFIIMVENKTSREKRMHFAIQRIPSSNRLNHLCKVRNYMEYISFEKSQSTFLSQLRFFHCFFRWIVIIVQNGCSFFHSSIRLRNSKIPFERNWSLAATKVAAMTMVRWNWCRRRQWFWLNCYRSPDNRNSNNISQPIVLHALKILWILQLSLCINRQIESI